MKTARNSTPIILCLTALCACLAGIASGIYTPMIVAIADDFGGSINDIQSSVVLFMTGLSISQLFYGPLSEGFGRKRMLLIGLGIIILGSFLCYFATSILALWAGRLVQGLGAGATASLWRSVFKDSFSESDIAKYLPFMTVVLTIVVPLAPTIGAFLSDLAGWRSTILFVFVYTVVTLVFIYRFFNETNTKASTKNLTRDNIIKSYKELLSSPIFMGYSFCIFVTYGVYFSWMITGPVIIINALNETPHTFSTITLLGGVTMAISGFLSRYVIAKVGMQDSIVLGWGISLFAGVLMLGGAVFYPSHVYAVAIPMIIFYFGSIYVWPASFAGAFAPFGHIAGYAGSLYGFLYTGGAGILGLLVSCLPDDDQFPLAWIMTLAPTLTLTIFFTIIKPAVLKYQATLDASPA